MINNNNINQDDNNKRIVTDDALDKVSGGGDVISLFPSVVTYKLTRYRSGDTPKYAINETVEIMCKYMGRNYRVECVILGVSKTRNKGLFCKEFSYTVQLQPTYGFVRLLGSTVYTGVYESCLYK